MKNFIVTFLLGILLTTNLLFCQKAAENSDLDKKVKTWLDEHAYNWHDMNVPYTDGKLLYDLVLKNGYTSALEIGTSTGHSGIWIAWALSKTGGKLITIDIDERRHNQALQNFKDAGVAEYIDARLADAHELVKELKGPFDFVFSDADKDWYKNYFIDVAPKLKVGGCFTAHNVSMRYSGGGIKEFIDYVKSLPNFDTHIDKDSRAGVSISYKKSE
ncbi:class I SAM-dependent methyltransferase [candidate division KSB1 bacterium]|nr:class I SAM-dependent methyltransferase [candidate division KSB1 bacterium]